MVTSVFFSFLLFSFLFYFFIFFYFFQIKARSRLVTEPSRVRERNLISRVGWSFLAVSQEERKREDERVSAAFYGARGGVPGQNSIGHSRWMKCIISKFQRQKQFLHWMIVGNSFRYSLIIFKKIFCNLSDTKTRQHFPFPMTKRFLLSAMLSLL